MFFSFGIFLFFLLGYSTDDLFGSGKFFVSTGLLYFWIRYFYPNEYSDFLGIKPIKWFHLPLFIFLLSGFFGLSYFCIQHVLEEKQLSIEFMSYKDLFCPFFQTLNEEWVFRSFLLRMFPVGSTFLPAMIFTGFHDIFYRFNLLVENRGELSYIALGTIFFFGLTLNTLWQKTRNILWVWAIHLGWNLLQFGFRIVDQNTRNVAPLKEVDVFNLLAGNAAVLALSSGVFFIVLYFTLDVIVLHQSGINSYAERFSDRDET